MIGMLFLLLAGHAYADFALQTPHHSAAKCPGNKTGIPWQVGLGYHALIHGGIVALVTGYWWLGVAETIIHGTTDHIKWRRWIDPLTDQAIHIGCKIIWVIIAISV